MAGDKPIVTRDMLESVRPIDRATFTVDPDGRGWMTIDGVTIEIEGSPDNWADILDKNFTGPDRVFDTSTVRKGK